MILLQMSLQLLLGTEAGLNPATSIMIAAERQFVSAKMLVPTLSIRETFMEIETQVPWAFEAFAAVVSFNEDLGNRSKCTRLH